MDVTVIIQAGTEGPVKVKAMPLAGVERALKHWQEGAAAPLHLRAVHEGSVMVDLSDLVIFADWHQPAAVDLVEERHGDGLTIRDGLAATHETWLRKQDAARNLAELRSLT
jgi:hypothetical protein